MIIDKFKHYEGVSNERLVEACGLLSIWLYEAEIIDEVIDAEQYIRDKYMFPCNHLPGSTIEGGGIMKFPDDPDLYPLISGEVGDTQVHIYEYAFIAFVHKNKPDFVTRMD
jgi:hypothetical protein